VAPQKFAVGSSDPPTQCRVGGGFPTYLHRQ